MLNDIYNAPNISSVILSGGDDVYQPTGNIPYMDDTANNVWFNDVGESILKNTVDDFHTVENNIVFQRNNLTDPMSPSYRLDGIINFDTTIMYDYILSGTIEVITATGFEYDKAISLSGDNHAVYTGDIVGDIDSVYIEYSTDNGEVWEILDSDTSILNLFSISGSSFYLGTDDGNYFNNMIANVRWYDSGGELLEFFPMNERSSEFLYGVKNSIYLETASIPSWVDKPTVDDSIETASLRSPFIGGQFGTGALSGVYIPTRLYSVTGSVYNWSTVDVFGNQLSPEEFDKRTAFEVLLEYSFNLRDDLSLDTYHSLESNLSGYPVINPDIELDTTNSSIFELVEGDPITCYFSAISGIVDTFTFESGTDRVDIITNNVPTTLTTVIGITPHAYYIEMDDMSKGKFNITYDNNYQPIPSYAEDFQATFTLPSSQTIYLPIHEEDQYGYYVDPYEYNFTVDWGDGSPIDTVTAWNDANKSHTYAGAGIYQITISGLCESFSTWKGFMSGTFRSYLTSVESLGNLGWLDLADAFSGCTSLITFDGNGNTPYLFNISYMFSDCTSITTIDLSMMSTSLVEEMDSTFWDCTVATSIDVSSFDTGSCDLMLDMFHGCELITTVDVSGWNMINVNNMRYMFTDCFALTYLDLSGWVLTTTMWNVDWAFSQCTQLAITLDPAQWWNNASITDYDYTFEDCTSITNYGDIPPSWK
jgi:surface protein